MVWVLSHSNVRLANVILSPVFRSFRISTSDLSIQFLWLRFTVRITFGSFIYIHGLNLYFTVLRGFESFPLRIFVWIERLIRCEASTSYIKSKSNTKNQVDAVNFIMLHWSLFLLKMFNILCLKIRWIQPSCAIYIFPFVKGLLSPTE